MSRNPRGVIAVKFDGKTLPLRLTVNSMCMMEEVRDADFETIMEGIMRPDEDGQRVTVRGLRFFFWGLMLDAMPEATEDDAGRLMNELNENPEDILYRALEAAFPEKDGGEEAKAPGKRRAAPR